MNKRILYLPLRIAAISFLLQLGFYILNRHILHPHIFKSIESNYSKISNDQRLDTLQKEWIRLKKEKLPFEEAKQNFEQLANRQDVLGGMDTFQSTVGFPYIYLIFLIMLPFGFIIAHSNMAGRVIAFFDFTKTIMPPFQEVPTFSNYLHTAVISVICLLIVGYITLGLVLIIKNFKNWIKQAKL